MAMKVLPMSMVVLSLFVSLSLPAQSYSRDTSFHPLEYIDSITLYSDPMVWNILELDDGRLFCAGIIGDPSMMTPSLVLMSQDGIRDYSFAFLGHADNTYYHVFKAKNDTLMLCMGGSFQKWDFDGNWINMDWGTNLEEYVDYRNWKSFHFYEDESFVAVGTIYLDNDPTIYEMVKIKSDGYADTNFVIDAVQGWDQSVYDLFGYSENQFLVSGHFTSWLGYPINNFCRINVTDASIDTSFQSIFSNGYMYPEIALPDGKVIVRGRFMIESDTTFHHVVRINPDGSLDSTFNNFNGPGGAPNINVAIVCPTPDGGYLVGGIFKTYQGYPRGNIAKIDADGFLDTIVLTGPGFDTIGYDPTFGFAGVYEIIPAQNNKYYVGGSFNLFNGQEVKPLVRIFGEIDDAVLEVEKPKLQIYPNPTKEKLSINAGFHIGEVEIYNITCHLVCKLLINSSRASIDVSNLPTGNYILRITSKDDVCVEKFVVMR